MQNVTVSEFKKAIEKAHGDPAIDFINVCTPEEYAAMHIEGARSVPLDELDRHFAEFEGKKTIYVHCRSGGRSRAAIEELQHLGVRAELVNVEGGLLAWLGAGHPTHSGMHS